MRVCKALGLVLMLAGPAAAEVDLGAVAACAASHKAAGTVPAPCVAEAMAACHAVPADAPALASACYRDAREVWSQGIAAHMATIRESAPEEIAAIAGVEVKYDLLAGLIQCDRMEALALIGPAEAADIQRQKDGCAATAAGTAYLRLVWRSQGLE